MRRPARNLSVSARAHHASAWQSKFGEAGPFRASFDHSGIGMMIVDMDGSFLHVNRTACEITGYSAEELLKLDFQTITHPDDLDLDLTLARRLFAGEIEHYQMDKRYLHKKGHVIWIQLLGALVRDAQGRPCYALSQIQDITERKSAEREATERLREIEELVDVATLLLEAFERGSGPDLYNEVLLIVLSALHSRDGCFLHFDERGTLCGPTIVQGVTRKTNEPARVVHPLWQAALDQRSVMTADDEPGSFGVPGRQHAMVAPILYRQQPIALLHVSRESGPYNLKERAGLESFAKIISPMLSARLDRDREQAHRRRVEAALREHQGKLAHVLRLNTMGEMAAALAHELNQPLSAITNFARGAVRHARQQSTAPKEWGEVALAIAHEADRASGIVRSVRGYIKQCELQCQPLVIDTLVQDVLRMLEPEFQAQGIEFSLHSAATDARVSGDAIQIEQVLVNLLRNAIDALEARPLGRKLLLEVLSTDTRGLQVVVTDNGGGFEHGDKIFDAFFTTKTQGLGLGLAISRTIIESHGGRLWAESSPESGAIFRFILPATTDATPR